MTTTDPLSLAQAKRLAASADTILLRATRPADLETPIGAFLRLDDGGPAYLLESVEGGERLGRYSFLGVGPRRLLEVRDGRARIQTRPVTVREYAPDRIILNVDLEEQSTGEFQVSGGYSTADGFLAEVSVAERNLLGRGLYAKASVVNWYPVGSEMIRVSDEYATAQTCSLRSFEKK